MTLREHALRMTAAAALAVPGARRRAGAAGRSTRSIAGPRCTCPRSWRAGWRPSSSRTGWSTDPEAAAERATGRRRCEVPPSRVRSTFLLAGAGVRAGGCRAGLGRRGAAGRAYRLRRRGRAVGAGVGFIGCFLVYAWMLDRSRRRAPQPEHPACAPVGDRALRPGHRRRDRPRRARQRKAFKLAAAALAAVRSALPAQARVRRPGRQNGRADRVFPARLARRRRAALAGWLPPGSRGVRNPRGSEHSGTSRP